MEKVIVIGSPGAGKSTFARRLGALTGLPLHHLDLLWHRPDRTTITPEAFDAGLAELLRGERWIIDGNYSRTLEARLTACNTAFFLDYPLEVCLAGAQARIGRKREDFPYLETELDPEFYQWILDFPQRHLPRLRALAAKYQVQLPIIEQVNQILFEGKSAAQAVKELMLRDKKIEVSDIPWPGES